MSECLKKLFALPKKDQEEGSGVVNENAKFSILGSWRLVGYTGYQAERIKPHWRELWSFAAMDDTETNGVYVCDYVNLHSIVGKWELIGERIKLIRKELVREYRVAELTADTLMLQAADGNEFFSSIEFCRDM